MGCHRSSETPKERQGQRTDRNWSWLPENQSFNGGGPGGPSPPAWLLSPSSSWGGGANAKNPWRVKKNERKPQQRRRRRSRNAAEAAVTFSNFHEMHDDDDDQTHRSSSSKDSFQVKKKARGNRAQLKSDNCWWVIKPTPESIWGPTHFRF